MRKQFEVLAGQHVEGSGETKKIYKTGTVVVSDQNLVKLFPLKFRDLGPADEEAKVAETSDDDSPDTVATATTTVAKPTTKKKSAKKSDEWE